jgi:hypothetical protein
MSIVIQALLVFTRSPLVSSTRTVSAGVIEEPAGVFVGCCPNTSFEAAWTVTVGWVAILAKEPPLIFVCVVNWLTAAVVGAVTPLNVTVN